LFRKVEEKGGLNTAVHILMDVSGSMRGQSIIMARQACFALAKGMAGIKGLNVAVTAFPALESEDSVYPVMQHGARAVPYPNVDTYGSTPLAAALWWVVQAMLPLKENRKLILLLTDGQPDNMPTAEFAVKSAQKAGFEVYGIGIREPSITRLLPHTSR
ncbi:MAG: VWA domain-containing protein, partial [Desulfovibrio sp.]|nr:VWA domain-containing protein [Desulfovibrio sp.]